MVQKNNSKYVVQLRKDFEFCKKVFVYGTLKEGHGNNRLLSTSTFLTSTVTKDKDYILAEQGCPVAIPYHKSNDLEVYPISGEVHEVDEISSFYYVDCLEGYPIMYDRKIVETACGHTCWMYYMDIRNLSKDSMVCPVVDGAWHYPRDNWDKRKVG